MRWRPVTAARSFAERAGGGSSLCTPSCYEPEQPSPDANKKTTTCAHFTKGFCETAVNGSWSEPELNQGGTLQEVVPDCRFPAPDTGKWASMSRRAVGVLDAARGDVAFIPADAEWYDADSSDGSRLRCLDLHLYARAAHLELTKCGTPDEATVCEAVGSKSARAINVAHFRIDEATRLAATDKQGCQQAALQAIAFSRGLPKYKTELGAQWVAGLTYKTRYDGVVSEKRLFSKLRKLGARGLELYESCGGTDPTTTPDDEMAFTR